MKFLILAAAVAAVSAVPAAVNTGSSAVTRSEDGLGNYAFGYNEDHATGGTFRKEQGGPGHVSGSYGLRDADGRVRTVNYVADALGYRASISTNEPGTDVKQDPAAADFNLGGAVVAAAPLIAQSYASPIVKSYAAPIIAAPLIAKSYAAPIAIAAPIASSYSVATQHVSAPVLAAPLLTKAYASPILAAAPALIAKAGYAGYGAPVVSGYGYNTVNKLY